MIILLYGQDSYRSRQKLSEVIKHYQKTDKSGLSLTFFDNQKLKFIDFKNIFEQVSMFNEKKLIILFNSFSDKIFKENIFKNIKSFIESKDVLLFYEENDITKKDSFLVFLKKQLTKEKKTSYFSVKIQEFQPLKGEKLKNWVKKEFSLFNKEINLDALDKMIDFIGNDLWRFSNEIKKLVNYHGQQQTKKEKISSKDVELLIKPKTETAIFKTIDAIALKDKKRALFLIYQHLNKGESPLYLLSMINFQFKNLLIVKDFIEKGIDYHSVLKLTRFHPFVLRKNFQQADRFTFQELKKITQKIFQADFNIKTGRIKPETAIDLLIAGI